MANYTDNVQALSKFNPYISQAPIIEEMSIVGREKQAKYDAGVEKIQGQIDQVAGMDLVKDEHKSYLQKSMNQLGTNLKFVAAGDFSNYQLVNSVGGMVSSIGKDKIIQGAVASTNAYRKDVATMDQAKKDGKSSPSNEYFFADRSTKWLKDGDVKSSYNSSYKPYTNYKKNAIEVIKALTKSENIADDAFAGIDEKGNPIISDVTVRRKLAGIPPEQIQQALMQGLTPADFEQMQIDGIYTYANTDGRTFYDQVGAARNSSLQFYNTQKKELEASKESASIKQREAIDLKIASLDKAMLDVASGYDQVLEMTGTNLESAKAQFFTKNAIEGFSKAFSFTETSQTYVGKTPSEMEMWREENRYKAAKDYADWLQRQNFHRDDMNLKAAELAYKIRKDQIEAGIDAPAGGTAKPIPANQVPVYSRAILGERRNALAVEVAADRSAFLDEYKDEKGQKHDAAWYNYQYNAWKERPSAIEDATLSQHFADISDKERRLELIDNNMAEVVKMADAKHGTLEDFIPKEDAVTVQDPETGTPITYSAEDIVVYNNKAKYGGFMKYVVDHRGAATIKFDDVEARRQLSDKEFKIYNAFKNSKTADDKKIIETVQKYNKEVNNPYGKVLAEKDKFIEDELSKRLTNTQSVGYGVDAITPKQKQRMSQILALRVEVAKDQKNGLANSPDWDQAIAEKIITQENVTYTIDVREGTSMNPELAGYKVTAHGKDGESVSFYMTPQEKAQQFGSAFDASPEVLAIRPYQEAIRMNGGITTNKVKAGGTNNETAFLTKNEFPSVVRYGINGDLKQVGTDGNGKPRYDILINVYDPIKKKWINNIRPLGGKNIGEGEIYAKLAGLDDTVLHQLINEVSATTAKDLDDLAKAAKEPY